MTILLIDDDPISLRLLAMTVGRLGYEAVAVPSGEAGLAWLAGGDDCQLVITDLTMPGMSGLQVFTAIRTDARWSDVPVLLCTGSADAVTVREAIAVGVRHYVVKPIKPSVIAAKVAELARPRRAAPVVVATPAAVATADDAAAVPAASAPTPEAAGAPDPAEASPAPATEAAT